MKKITASALEVNELTLYIVNTGNMYKKISKNIFPKLSKILNDKNALSKATLIFMPIVKEAIRQYDRELPGHDFNFTMQDKTRTAAELADYYINLLKSETATIAPAPLVHKQSKDFDDEVSILRKYFGSLRMSRHPIMSHVTVIYSIKIGKMKRQDFFRLRSYLRRINPDYKLSNAWKNDAILTESVDKRPNYTGCEFTLEIERNKTKHIMLDIPSMSIIMWIE